MERGLPRRRAGHHREQFPCQLQSGQFLDRCAPAGRADPVRHMRLAALQRSRPLLGAELMASWRTRAGAFPDHPGRGPGRTGACPGGASVGAAMPSSAAATSLRSATCSTRAGHAAVRAVLALNRIYLPHSQLKWQRHLITGLRLAPAQLAERLQVDVSRPARGRTTSSRSPLGGHRGLGRGKLRRRHQRLPRGTGTTPPGDRSAATQNLTGQPELPVLQPASSAGR